MGGRGAVSSSGKSRIKAALESSEPLQRDYAKATKTVYEKPRKKLTDDERAAVDQLEAIGVFPVVRKENPNAPANIDLSIDGVLWEIKNVTSEGSVSSQYNRARKQWKKLGLVEPVNVVFSTQRANASFGDIVGFVKKRMHDGEAAIVLSPNGDYELLQK